MNICQHTVQSQQHQQGEDNKMEKSAFDLDTLLKEPEFDFNGKRLDDSINDILKEIYKEIEEEENGSQKTK